MNVVYFGQEFHQRAPDAIGCLCVEPSTEWVSLLDICAAMARGEVVTIRPASEGEMKRAEMLVSIHEIGMQMGMKITELLDGKPKEAMAAATAFRDAAERTLGPDVAPFTLLDSNMGADK